MSLLLGLKPHQAVLSTYYGFVLNNHSSLVQGQFGMPGIESRLYARQAP